MTDSTTYSAAASVPAKLTIAEHTELITGYDEEKIRARFGHPVFADVEHEPLIGIRYWRALVFAAGLRDGLGEDDAYIRAMSMTTKDVDGFFAVDEGEEIDDEAPDTESGKGASLAG